MKPPNNARVRHHRHGLNRTAQLLGLTVVQCDHFLRTIPGHVDRRDLAKLRALVKPWLERQKRKR